MSDRLSDVEPTVCQLQPPHHLCDTSYQPRLSRMKTRREQDDEIAHLKYDPNEEHFRFLQIIVDRLLIDRPSICEVVFPLVRTANQCSSPVQEDEKTTLPSAARPPINPGPDRVPVTHEDAQVTLISHDNDTSIASRYATRHDTQHRGGSSAAQCHAGGADGGHGHHGGGGRRAP